MKLLLKTVPLILLMGILIYASCKKDQLPLLKQILKEHHPYEEVAIDIFQLLNF